MTSYFVKTESPDFRLPQVILDNLPDWATPAEVDEAIEDYAKAHPPVAAAPTSHLHVQSTAAAVWNIPHPLGFNPSVTITDSAGMVRLTEIEYFPPNLIRSTSAAAFSGTAYLS